LSESGAQKVGNNMMVAGQLIAVTGALEKRRARGRVGREDDSRKKRRAERPPVLLAEKAQSSISRAGTEAKGISTERQPNPVDE